MTTARIMIVEDERITAEAIKGTLEDLGYAVSGIAATGADAIRKAGDERPDLVLMDIMLKGGMDGIEAAEQIRSAHLIPIVYATAYADEPLLRRAKVTVPYGYIIKPFTTRELHSTIEMALHKSRLDRQIARLNAVLDSIRRVNQLVIRAHARDHLLQGVCDLLVKHRGYAFAWAVLFDDDGKLNCSAQAGLGNEPFQTVLDLLKRGDNPTCVRRVLAESDSVIVSLRAIDCPDCPLQNHYPCEQALAARLRHGGRNLGLLSAGALATLTIDDAERVLFGEVADDISVALHAISAEADRNRAEQALRHAQRMETVGQLAAGVAHDFNNLLMAIHGYAELARAELPSGHRASEILAGIDAAVRQATGVTRGLLTFSGRAASPKEPIDLAALLHDVAGLLHHLLPAAIQLDVVVQGETPVCVHADPTQLQQVLMNLAVNARDAMPDGGRLRIVLCTVPVSASDDSGEGNRVALRQAEIEVSDTGVGMSPEVQARIFEPFFTTKPQGAGTGLGLAIVRSIVEDHRGRLEVETAPAAGTTFRVCLPCAEAGVALRSGPVRGRGARGSGELLLLAEDDPYVRDILATSLFQNGYRVVPVADGIAMWDQYLENREALRALVVDVDLPHRSGLDCLGTIRARGDPVPAIIISAAVEIPRAALGTHGILMRKPFQLAELSEAVAEVLSTSRLKELAQ